MEREEVYGKGGGCWRGIRLMERKEVDGEEGG